MKKLLLIPALLGSIAMANDAQYEITPVIGYNIAEGNLNLKNEILTGIEAQYTGCKLPIKPELSVLYSGGVESDDLFPSDKTNIFRLALNGVYDLPETGHLIPFVKAGFGYETMNRHFANNSDGAFVDAGAGVKIPFTEDLALKLETVYMLKHNFNSAGNTWGDSNLAVLAGLNFAFGSKAAPTPVTEPEQTPEPETTPEPVDGDDDNDGVLNSVDKCPTTPSGDKVDADGCTIVEALPVVAETKAEPVCPPKVNLHINFEFDSAKVDEDSLERVEKFSEFLKCTPEYKAKIIGHTDSVGSDAYNQKLSQKRADAVRNMIVKDGVPSDKISTDAKGESQPIATNKTKEGRAQNRRIEAELIKQ